jgi:hypothetical protein
VLGHGSPAVQHNKYSLEMNAYKTLTNKCIDEQQLHTGLQTVLNELSHSCTAVICMLEQLIMKCIYGCSAGLPSKVFYFATALRMAKPASVSC